MTVKERNTRLGNWLMINVAIFSTAYVSAFMVTNILPPVPARVTAAVLALAAFVASIYWFPPPRVFGFIVLAFPAVIVFPEFFRTGCVLDRNEAMRLSLFPFGVIFGYAVYFDFKDRMQEVERKYQS